MFKMKSDWGIGAIISFLIGQAQAPAYAEQVGNMHPTAHWISIPTPGKSTQALNWDACPVPSFPVNIDVPFPVFSRDNFARGTYQFMISQDGNVQNADSAEVAHPFRHDVARVFRDDVAHCSGMISPRSGASVAVQIWH